MSLAENLLNSLDETAYSSVSVSNVVEEEHIIIDNARIMIVPSSLKTIAVTGDKDIETVTFDCVRYWDEHDFATFALYINYTLPNGNTGTYIPQNVSASEDHISFTWTIERYITLDAGRLTVSIEAVKTDESGNVLYQWGSIPNSDMTIIKGQSRSDIPEDEISTDVVSQVLQAANDASKYASEVYALYGDISDYASVVSQHDKRIKNLEQAISSSPFETDSSVAYVKSVPSNALPYAEIGKVGGMTRKSKNLAKSSKEVNVAISGVSAVTKTNVSYFTLNGTSSQANALKAMREIELQAGTYCVSVYGLNSNGEDRLYIGDENSSTIFVNYIQTNAPKSFTITEAKTVFVQFVFGANSTYSNKEIQVQIEPGNTATQYEPYYEGLRSAKVTEIKSVGANLIPFPYYDNSKTLNGVTFTVLDDGGINIKGTPEVNFGFYPIYDATSSRLPIKAGVYTVSITKCDGISIALGITGATEYDAHTENGTTFTVTEDNTMYARVRLTQGVAIDATVYPMLNVGASAAPYKPYVGDIDTFAIPAEVQALDGYGESNPNNANEYNYIDFEQQKFVAYGHIVDGSWVAYDAPIETDISDFITEDNFIEVEGGGTITMVNEYSLAVPSEITYMLKEVTV